MFKHQSIRFRLTAWYAAILAITFFALGIGLRLAIRKSINKTVNADLESRAQRMSQFLTTFHSDQQHIAEEMEEQGSLTSLGTVLLMQSSTGNWIYRSPGTETWGNKVPGEGIDTRVIAGKTFRVITRNVIAGRLQIGLPFDGYERVIGDFTWTLFLGSPLALVIACAGGYWMGGRALAPVDRIVDTAQRISAQQLSERLQVNPLGDELDRLSATLNDMFERLESSFGRMARFTADASHELRTPAAIIKTTAEIATNRPRNVEEHVKAWQLVLKETERTTHLLDNLMVLARADSGDFRPEFVSVDLSACLRDACSEARVLADKAGLDVRTEIAGGVTVLGDYDSLRRTYLIFLDNAIKYTPAGGEISVLLQAGAECAQLHVSDNGIGIAEGDQRLIFDRFYRVSKDRSRKSGGAGLGLSIAQQIVSLHGGKIEVVSSVRKGSLFSISLPVFSPPSDSNNKTT